MKIASDLFLIAIGGALGAVSRYGLNQMSLFIFGKGFPVGTLLANLVGCLLIGILFGATAETSAKEFKLAFGVGFLGSLTTFSTLAAESVAYAEQDQWIPSVLNIVLNVILGIFCVVIGLWIGRRIAGF